MTSIKRETSRRTAKIIHAENFWNDNLSAKKVLQEVNSLEGWIKEWENSKSSLEDISVLIELAEAENDTSLQKKSKII